MSNESGAEPANSIRKRFSALPRSKSSGRDPRLTDMMNAYQARPDQHDTASRDSGHHSAAGAPELGGRGLRRGNSFPVGGVQAEAYSDADTVSLYSGHSDHTRYDGGTLDNRSIHSFDNRSVLSLDNRSVNSWDNRSVNSLDNHHLNWSPLENAVVPKLTGKRKYSTFDEAISDDDDELLAKRPRTPDHYDTEDAPCEGSRLIILLKKILRTLLKLILLIAFVVTCLLCYTTYKNYQCSYKQSQAIDINLIDRELSSNLFGQHLAHTQIISSLTSFTESSSSPLLTLSVQEYHSRRLFRLIF